MFVGTSIGGIEKMSRGRRRKLHFSKIYSFACGTASLKDDHSQLGGPGFSRVVFCNEPECFEAEIRNYIDNHISTKFKMGLKSILFGLGLYGLPAQLKIVNQSACVEM